MSVVIYTPEQAFKLTFIIKRAYGQCVYSHACWDFRNEEKSHVFEVAFLLLSVLEDYCFLRSVLFDNFPVTLMEKLYVFLVGLTPCSYRDVMMMMMMMMTTIKDNS
jgi:hypothetical protein